MSMAPTLPGCRCRDQGTVRRPPGGEPTDGRRLVAVVLTPSHDGAASASGCPLRGARFRAQASTTAVRSSTGPQGTVPSSSPDTTTSAQGSPRRRSCSTGSTAKPRQALEHTGGDRGPIELDGAGLDLRKLALDELDTLQQLVARANLAAEIWFARLWRRVQDAPRTPWAERRWEWVARPPGHPDGRYRLLEEDDTRRLLRELHDVLEDDDGTVQALAALERLAEQVGMEPPPHAALSDHVGAR
jgi:hypothetical protein